MSNAKIRTVLAVAAAFTASIAPLAASQAANPVPTPAEIAYYKSLLGYDYRVHGAPPTLPPELLPYLEVRTENQYFGPGTNPDERETRAPGTPGPPHHPGDKEIQYYYFNELEAGKVIFGG